MSEREVPFAFLRRWIRRCPDCGARGCKGTPDSELWTNPGLTTARDYYKENALGYQLSDDDRKRLM